MDKEDGKFIRHEPCPYCHSKDNVGVYDDGHAYCFGCNRRWTLSNEELEQYKMYQQRERSRFMPETVTLPGQQYGIPDRGISLDTCKKFGVKVTLNNQGVTEHFYPYYDKDGNLIAYKKRIVNGKSFSWAGNAKDSVLFGMNAFPKGGKYVTVCEGECDCMACYQMFSGTGAYVSLKNGSKDLKAVKDAYEWLDSFENIIVCVDGDAPGRECSHKIAEVLPPGKVRVVKMPESPKDANDFLKLGKVEEFKKLWWQAEDQRPEDVVNINSTLDRVLTYRESHDYIPTPWSGLNELIQGTRAGQLVVLTAGSGQGKSSFMRAWMLDLLRKNRDIKVGCFFMEESIEETIVSMMSLAAGENLKRTEIWDSKTKEELTGYFKEVLFDGRIEMFEPKENMTPDYIVNKIRYMAMAKNCKIIFLDHLSILVDSSDNVRMDLNRLCKDVHQLCVGLGITVIAAIHLRKSQSNVDHESGAEVRLDDIKDSSSVKQLSDVVIAFERNGQSDVEKIQNLTKVRVLKNRDFGEKGLACGLMYDRKTTRLDEIPKEVAMDIEHAVFTEDNE